MKSKLKNISSNTGKFIDGNPTSGELGTIVTAEWLNGVQERVQDTFEELKNVLALGNLQPDGNKTTQVADAIRAYVQTFNLKIESNTRSLANVIPNSKKSSAVDSNSEDTVANSAAVKTAYDKAVEVEELANKKWTAKSATETEPGILPISHKTDGADKNKFASEYAVGEAAKKGLPLGAVVSFPRAMTNPIGFLRADGTTFNQQTFPDLYRVLGSDKLPDLTRSDVGMTAYFAVDNIPNGWIAFDEIVTQVTEQRYPELYRHLVGKYGSIASVPKVADRFLRNAGNGLYVGQTQEDGLKRHAHKVPLNNAYTKDTLKNYNGNTEYTDFGVPKTILMTLVGDGVVTDNYYAMPTDDDAKTGGDETRPKSLVLKLYIKAINSFDDVVFWIKSHGEATNAGTLDAGRLAQGLQDKADRNHAHTASQITDFNQATSQIINAAITYQKIGDIEVRKYPDGTMIQTCRKHMLTGDYSKVNFNWAVAFTEMPILTATAQYFNSVGDHDTIITFVQGTSNSACHLVCGETYNNSGEIAYVNIIAIGRWKR